MRTLQKTNYIPHKITKRVQREVWHNNYMEEIMYMYRILQCIINNYFQNKKIDWNSPIIIQNFSRLLFRCSTKKII